MISSKKRPVIGITTSVYKSRIAWAFDWISVALVGGIPVRLTPETPHPLPKLDGLILGGGDDISADIYGGELVLNVRIDKQRDKLELSLLERYVDQNIPIFGICRGVQMINVFFGGTLSADINQQHPNIPPLHTPLPSKTVNIIQQSRLHHILKADHLTVNSLHHQAIETLGQNLIAVCFDKYGLIQGIEHQQHENLLGVQWHPEFLLFKREQRRLFQYLVATSIKHRN